VRPVDQARAEADDLAAGCIEFLQRRHARSDTGLAAAAIVDPEARAVAVDVDADCLSPRPAFRQLRPMFDDVIRIWCAVRIVGLDLAGGDRKDSSNSRAEETHTKRYAYAFPHGDPP
jgi:hypothetical protein